MIEISGLTKTYGAFTALDDISFQVPRGHVVGFLGANGAGKTTTMDIICGCIGADQGSVKICDFDITEQPIDAKRRLGYLPDQAPLHTEMRVDDYVDYVAEIRGIPTGTRMTAKARVIEKLDLGEVRHRIIGNLSKGFRQRVALAQALVHDPDVLVLDEPTEGLDPTQIIHIRELIKSLSGQHTIVLSSHILSEVQNVCDSLVIIHKGRVVQKGTYQEILSSMMHDTVYHLRVAQNPDGARAALQSIAGVENIAIAADHKSRLTFTIHADQPDTVVDNVVAQVSKGGFGLRELTPKTESLEEIFLQLTK